MRHGGCRRAPPRAARPREKQRPAPALGGEAVQRVLCAVLKSPSVRREARLARRLRRAARSAAAGGGPGAVRTEV
jgi:hypothetical protein